MEINEELKTDNKTNTQYLIYESAVVRLERINKRLWITNIIKDIILVIVVCGFLLFLNQFEIIDYTQDSTGVNIIGDKNGVDYNGTTTTNVEEKENSNES